jgi:hypothetical protein
VLRACGDMAECIRLRRKGNRLDVLESGSGPRQELEANATIQPSEKLREDETRSDESDERHADGPRGKLGEPAGIHARTLEVLVGWHVLIAVRPCAHLP